MRSMSSYRVSCLAIVVCSLNVATANAAEYRILPENTDVLAGETLNFAVEVETMSGDNLVGIGHFSFAIDLTLSGTAGAAGTDIRNIAINQLEWDDTLSNQLGSAQGNEWIGVGGVTEDAVAPNFGSTVGEVVDLFTFDLTVPADASLGDTIVITPAEGFLQNLTVSDFFDPVEPQTFAAATLTVVPEPTTATLLGFAGLVSFRRRM